MKRNTEKLLDGLLEDTVPPEFHAALMGKTLHSARRRKRVRRFSMTVSAMAVAGIFVFSFWKIREPALPPAQTRQPDLMVVNSHPLQPAQIVTDKSSPSEEFTSSTSPCGEVRTTGSSGLYMEINDGQLLAVQSIGTPVPVHHGSGKGTVDRMAAVSNPPSIKNRPHGFAATTFTRKFDQRLVRFGLKNTGSVTPKMRIARTAMLKKRRKGTGVSAIAFLPAKTNSESHP